MKQKEFWQEQDTGSKDGQFQADLLFIAKSEQGRRFLKDLLLAAGVFAEIPVANPNLYAYYEGRRSLGLMLYHRLYALGSKNGANYLMQIQEQE